MPIYSISKSIKLLNIYKAIEFAEKIYVESQIREASSRIKWKDILRVELVTNFHKTICALLTISNTAREKQQKTTFAPDDAEDAFTKNEKGKQHKFIKNYTF